MVNRKPEVLAVIPARGGSQGIPRKNLCELGGQPLIAWSIAAGQQARMVSRVIVSTDNREIAAEARLCGAEVPFIRPAELARNDTRDFAVFQHAVDWLERNECYVPDIVVQLRPTSPLRPRGLVDQAVELLISDDEADSVRSVTPPTQTPYKMWTIEGNALSPVISCDVPEAYNAPRQSLPPVYWQTGHVDAFRPRTIRQKHSITGDRILPVLVDSRYAVDIDAPEQLRAAQDLILSRDLNVVTPGVRMNVRLDSILLFVFDFDGVFTDNRVHVDESGLESVICSRADGLGIERLLDAGLAAAVLSSEVNPVVVARCRKLRLPVHHGVRDKGPALRNLVISRNVGLEHVAYVGNDINDLECLRIAGLSVAPADAHPDIRRIVHLVLANKGGNGAVRELCDLAIAAHQSKKEDYAYRAAR